MNDEILAAMEGAETALIDHATPLTNEEMKQQVSAIENLRAAIEKYKAQQSEWQLLADNIKTLHSLDAQHSEIRDQLAQQSATVDMEPVAYMWKDEWGHLTIQAVKGDPFAEHLHPADQLAKIIRQRNELLEAIEKAKPWMAGTEAKRIMEEAVAKIEGVKG